ncbi:hypothetical protein ACFGVR_17535 [Mucilaginibacter sp. AW1-3]
MFRRNIILLGIVTGVLLLGIAMLRYPGGSQADAHSVGYSFWHNYLAPQHTINRHLLFAVRRTATGCA